MNFIESIKTCFRKYFDFSGRARRSEYWWFYLFTILGGIVLDIIDMAIFEATSVNDIGILGTFFSLIVAVPTFSAAARRLHDTNRSGWWQLLPLAGAVMLLPGAGVLYYAGDNNPAGLILIVVGALTVLAFAILLIVWLATDSDRGPNRFGPSPKYESVADTFA